VLPGPDDVAFSREDVLRKNDFASRLVDDLDALVRHPAVGAAAATLAGTDEIRLWHDRLLYKPSERADGAPVVGRHTDRQYWGTCSSETMLTAWAPFRDVGEEIGNRSGKPRRALAIHLQTGDNRWTGGEGHDLVKLTGGDFADPFWCPRLYS